MVSSFFNARFLAPCTTALVKEVQCFFVDARVLRLVAASALSAGKSQGSVPKANAKGNEAEAGLFDLGGGLEACENAQGLPGW